MAFLCSMNIANSLKKSLQKLDNSKPITSKNMSENCSSLELIFNILILGI